MSMAILALGILFGGLALAREVNALGVLAVGKLLGADTSYTTNWELLPRARVLWTDAEGNSFRRSAWLVLGGLASGVALIAALLLGILAVLLVKAGGEYRLEMLGIIASLAGNTAWVWWETVGIPFRLDFWQDLFAHGILLPEARALRIELDSVTDSADILLVALRGLLDVTTVYLGLVVMPVFVGLGSFTNIVRRWLMAMIGEGVVMHFMDLCRWITCLALIALVVAELARVVAA